MYGGKIAARATRFTIREGQVTEIDLELHTGVRVPIEVTVPGTDRIRYVQLLLRRGSTRMLAKWVQRTAGRTYATEVYLDPGTYSVRGRATGFEGTIQIEVKAGTENPTAKLTLRPQ